MKVALEIPKVPVAALLAVASTSASADPNVVDENEMQAIRKERRAALVSFIRTALLLFSRYQLNDLAN